MPLPLLRWGAAALLTAGLLAGGLWLHGSADHGRAISWALLSGSAFGFVLQRSRFCFYCGLRELWEERDARPVLGLLAALATGAIGYLVVFGAWVPFPDAGHLPPRAHIGPSGWHLLLGGATFGLGMALSGSCISAHLYRLGEASLLAPVALLGTMGGFILGFNAWPLLYVRAITEAPVIWLPRSIGYAGSLTLHLTAIGVLAWWAWRRGQSTSPAPFGRSSPATLHEIARAVFIYRWHHWFGGVLVGFLAAAVYLRASPLGVTAELGRFARKLGSHWGVVPATLPGLDGFAGCATADHAGATLSPNGWFIVGLVTASVIAGLFANQFRPEWPSVPRLILALIGGILLGFGAMISLGCTIGTLLSGLHAFALSGWIFGAALVPGVWVGLKIRRRLGH